LCYCFFAFLRIFTGRSARGKGKKGAEQGENFFSKEKRKNEQEAIIG
jgi:hypothetical protein